MGSFNNNSITDAGRLLLGDVQMGATFQPTKIVLGSGRMPAGAIVQDMKAVVAPVIELGINKKKKANDGTVVIGGVYNNESIKEDFYFRELALFAKAIRPDGSEVAEVLYSYGNAGESADLMPAYTTGTAVERQIDLATYIGNDAKVDVTVESGLFIPLSDKGKAEGVATLGVDGKVPPEQLPEKKLSFDELMTKYGYTRTTGQNEAGLKTITVTVKEASPVPANMVVTFDRTESGDKLVTVITTIAGVAVKEQHTMNKANGEGGIVHG